MTPEETDTDLSMSVQRSLAEGWVRSGLLDGWATEYSSASVGLFEGGHNYPH